MISRSLYHLSVCDLMAVLGFESGGHKRGSASASSRVASSRARRCLFGPMSDEERANAESELVQRDRLIDQEKRRKWNFDFERMAPLPGRWQWERVGGASPDHLERSIDVPGSQATPPSGCCSTVDREPVEPSATPLAGVTSTIDVSASPVDSGSGTTTIVETSTTTPSFCTSDVTPTTSGASGPSQRLKRSRQSTLPGILSAVTHSLLLLAN